MADTAFSYEAKAVMTTQIISGQRACASRTRSTPDMPSMRMSVSSRSALLSSSALIAASALSTPTAGQPSFSGQASASSRSPDRRPPPELAACGTPYEDELGEGRGNLSGERFPLPSPKPPPLSFPRLSYAGISLFPYAGTGRPYAFRYRKKAVGLKPAIPAFDAG